MIFRAIGPAICKLPGRWPERYLAEAPERIQHILFGELLAFELEVRGRGGSIPDQAEYMARFPERWTGEIWVNPGPGSVVGSFEEWRFLPTADGYRLPTEAEWELACRATTTTNYSFGDDTQRLDEYGVANSVSTQACGSKLPNGWGLFDMHGNVSEWCNDWQTGYKYKALVNPRLIDPMGPPSDQEWNKTTKGSSWAQQVHRLLSSDSFEGTPHIVFDARIGFRVVRSLK